MKDSVLFCLLASAACGQAVDATANRTASADVVVSNGEQLNGEQLNGEQLNGEQLNGTTFTGPGMAVGVAFARFAGAAVDGTVLDGASLAGTAFHGVAGGRELSAVDFANAGFQASLLDGTPVSLRVTDVAREAFPNDDVWSYLVQFRDASGIWHPLCLDANNDAVYAIPLDGRWNYGRGVPGGGSHIDDPTTFTFACKGLGAIAKCVFPIGYKPWTTVNGVSLGPYHQACTRALRADYCGDGTPWTVDGRAIDLYDGIGIQAVAQPLWFFEAEWTAGSAACLSSERVVDLKNTLGTVSPCILSRLSLSCGSSSHFSRGTLLMNRFPLPTISLF
jgi:hypothetical protein